MITDKNTNFRVVDHSDGGKCLLDTNTLEYYRLPDLSNKTIIGGKVYGYFDTIKEYLESDFKTALIPVICNNIKKDKKRWVVRLLSGRDTFQFYNVEVIAGVWTRNEILEMKGMKAYFIFVEKHHDADNDFLIRGCKIIRN